MLVGYARVSTQDQTLALQRDALTAAGCERIFADTAGGAAADRPGLADALAAGCGRLFEDVLSGAKASRPGLDAAISFLRTGDTLVVWRLDRLGRSLPHLLETVTGLQDRGVGFRSLTEQLDTTTSGGKLVFHVFGALAEFERDVIRERTRAGLAAARARGRKGGRPRAAALDEARKVAVAQALYADTRLTVAEVCRALGVSRATLYRYVTAGRPRPTGDSDTVSDR